MLKQSSASGEGGDIRSGHLLLLNKPTIYSRLRTGTGGGTRLPPKKTIQMLCTLHHILKKMEIKFSGWRKDIRSVYLQGPQRCRLLQSYTHWLTAFECPQLILKLRILLLLQPHFWVPCVTTHTEKGREELVLFPEATGKGH